MTIVSGCPMERSIAEAFARLILWMEADYGWDRWRAYDLLTHVARISVGYYALGTVAVKIAKEFIGGPLRTRCGSCGTMIFSIAKRTAAGEPGIVRTTLRPTRPPTARLRNGSPDQCPDN